MQPFIETFTGRQAFLWDPKIEDIEINDIAHALSFLCRFGGHCRSFWSVAAHSLLVAQLLPPEHKLAGLLHDATEAYLVDVPSPLKQLLPDYREIEAKWSEVIARKFGVSFDHPLIKEMDLVALATEKRDLFDGRTNVDWGPMSKPAPYHVVPVNPELTCAAFLKEFHHLNNRIQP